MKKIAIGTLIYVFISFIIQGFSHFILNSEHYASITFMRAEPVLWMGVLVMVFQGIALTSLYSGLSVNGSDWKTGLLYGLTIAIVLVGYIAVVEPSKYQVASIQDWVLVEGSAGIVQFVGYGVLMGFLFKNDTYAV